MSVKKLSHWGKVLVHVNTVSCLWNHCHSINTTGVTTGAATVNYSVAPEFTPGFSGVRVTRSLFICVCFVDRCLSFFVWPLCCLSFFDLRIPYIEEEQTTQWPKEKVQKDKQRSTKHTYKTKDRVTRTPLKTGGELRFSGRVGISCSTSGTRRVNIATNPVISRNNNDHS